ncbi:hypothetical protein CRG98_038774 [Punica granatum]|uniref:Uncharacterized protein n=1 Tax=Punica granatum TaxID=22663 RepID=A0A2I0IAF3_PUNGR|nr:hypothetical protein CRG98_038774 [Punica granatum]
MGRVGRIESDAGWGRCWTGPTRSSEGEGRRLGGRAEGVVEQWHRGVEGREFECPKIRAVGRGVCWGRARESEPKAKRSGFRAGVSGPRELRANGSCGIRRWVREN